MASDEQIQQVNYVPVSQEKGTLRTFRGFDPQSDCEALNNAMEREKGGVKENTIMNIICFRTSEQRQIIKTGYEASYQKDLVKQLTSELKGDFEDVIVGLMYRPAQFDASELRHAMKGLGTKESTLIEILASRTNAEIKALNLAYCRMYERELEKDILDDTSRHLMQLLVLLSRGERDESEEVNEAKAKIEAQALYKAGEKDWGTNESVFNVIFATQSFAQLQAICTAYEEISGHDMEKAISKEFSGSLKDGLLAVVKCAKNKQGYFAERLRKSMKGIGTDDRMLKRIIIARCEVDMVQIKEQFERMYEKTLEKCIQDDISGEYKTAMLNLVGGSASS